jgi:hypothetical protein
MMQTPSRPPLARQAPTPDVVEDDARRTNAYTDENGWLLSLKGLRKGEMPLPVKLGFYRPHEWGTAPYTAVSTCAFGVHMH